MLSPATSDARQTLSTAAQEAKIALGQSTFAAVALRMCDAGIVDLAWSVYRCPGRTVKVGTQETPECQEARHQRIVRVLECIKARIANTADERCLFEAKDLGGVVNKMIITHAVAVLEAFLDNAAEPFKQRYKSCMSWPLPRSFGGKCAKLKCTADLSRECGHAEADLLANVRHVIVHRNGAVDPRFLAAATGSKSPLARDLASQTLGDQVRIPIDDFILPAMHGAVRFVDAAAQALQGKVCP